MIFQLKLVFENFSIKDTYHLQIRIANCFYNAEYYDNLPLSVVVFIIECLFKYIRLSLQNHCITIGGNLAEVKSTAEHEYILNLISGIYYIFCIRKQTKM